MSFTSQGTYEPMNGTNAPNREYRSSTFTAYFGTPEKAAELYRALGHDEDIGPEDIRFTTLEGVLYMARKNDMAFIAGSKALVIGEHQSTINQNMPLRSAIYYGRTMEMLIPPKDIYKTKQIAIPTSEFYTFYNGMKKQPSEQILKLSDSYIEKTPNPMLELTVRVININLSVLHPVLEKSRPLYEYSWFMQKIQDYIMEGRPREEAMAMEDCIDEGIMTDFISRYGSEVRNMLFAEFNMEDALQVRGEDAYEDGYEDGMAQGISRGMAQGITQGSMLKLVQQICCKQQKGHVPERIAGDLEEDLNLVNRVCIIAQKFAPGYDCEKICEAVRTEK